MCHPILGMQPRYDVLWHPRVFRTWVWRSSEREAARRARSAATGAPLRTFSALALFWCWLRSSWMATTIPEGRCVMRTALLVVFTLCPPRRRCGTCRCAGPPPAPPRPPRPPAEDGHGGGARVHAPGALGGRHPLPCARTTHTLTSECRLCHAQATSTLMVECTILRHRLFETEADRCGNGEGGASQTEADRWGGGHRPSVVSDKMTDAVTQAVAGRARGHADETCTRWTPLSNLSWPKAPLPLIAALAS